jgi:hypothetical protein
MSCAKLTCAVFHKTVNTSRIRFALLLPLLLVFAQQGAMLHELSHIHAGGSGQVRYENDLLAGKFCDTCAAFAQVGNPAAASVAVLPADAPVRHYVPAPPYSIVASEALPPRSRGPPRV